MQERALSVGEALLWAMSATLLLWFGLGLVVAVNPAAATEMMMVGGIEAVALLGITFFVLRTYSPERPILSALGIRGVHPGFPLLGVLLGTVLHLPTEWLRAGMEQLVPSSDVELTQRALLLDSHNWVERLTLMVVVAGVVPMVEEGLIRGALFGPLVRRFSVSTAVTVTAIAFFVLHLFQWRNAPALLLAGGLLSYLRAASGSLFPPLAMHAAFNATAVLAFWTGAASVTQPLRVSTGAMVAGWIATVVLVGTVHWLSTRSGRAATARAEDQG